VDGDIVAAAQEERFTRRKGDANFPQRAVEYCLEEAGLRMQHVTHVGFYDKPLLKFERILETYLGIAPRGLRQFLLAGPVWVKDKLFTDRALRTALAYDGQILYAEHHESHAASAFYPSPFEDVVDHALLAAALAAPGALLVLFALAAPAALVPVERAWMRGALAISRVTTPIIMGIAYLVVITPIGFAVRHLKGDPLRHAGPGDSYWIPRDREADRRGDLTRQF
jgi:predicted NodU family carbamoyl transferase